MWGRAEHVRASESEKIVVVQIGLLTMILHNNGRWIESILIVWNYVVGWCTLWANKSHSERLLLSYFAYGLELQITIHLNILHLYTRTFRQSNTYSKTEFWLRMDFFPLIYPRVWIIVEETRKNNFSGLLCFWTCNKVILLKLRDELRRSLTHLRIR